jgi:hypothetical protein
MLLNAVDDLRRGLPLKASQSASDDRCPLLRFIVGTEPYQETGGMISCRLVVDNEALCDFLIGQSGSHP